MAFSYERVKQHTGKVQYRTDGASVTTVAGKRVLRGEVIEAPKKSFADALVQGGNFAHVPADTPLGLPAQETAPEVPESPATPAPMIDSGEEF